MENRIARKIDGLISQFKNDVKIWFDQNESDVSGKHTKSEFLQFVFDHNTVNLSPDDFKRRKRVKNIVPGGIRCCAKRANGEQCTRRKKEDEEYCGTHIKGTPYGKVETDDKDKISVKKRDVWVQDIKGIQYYIDNESNVYNHEDIISNKINPEIIGKYVLTGDSKYSIPEFEINK